MTIKDTIRVSLDKPEMWFMRAVMLASAIAVVYYAGDKAKDAPTQAIYILLGLAVVGFHVAGAKKACAAWYDRRAVAFIGWLTVVGVAFVWEGNSQLSVASNNQDNLSQIQRTAATATEVNKDEVNRIAGRLLKLQSDAAWKSDLPAIGAIQARIDAARAHRFWAASDECKAPKGKQTAAHCDAYRQAEADKAMAIRRDELANEVKIAEKELAAARASLKTGPAVASATRADTRTLKRLTGLSDGDIEISQAVLMWLSMGAMLTLAGWLIKAEEFEGKPRRPWFRWRTAISTVRNAWDGKGVERIEVHKTYMQPSGHSLAFGK